jgi:hypothetical protein
MDKIKNGTFGTMRIYLHSLVFIVFLASVVRADLVHRYSFNNGDVNAIDSVGGQHGTLEGGATISGNAVQLNGTGAYVNLPSDLITGFTSVTFEAWFTCAADSGTWSRVWDFGDTNSSTGAGRNYVFFTPKSGSGTSRYAISDADPGYNHENIVETTFTATGVPVYVACVHNGTTGEVKIYVNGQLASSSIFSIPLSAVNNVFSYLGRSLYSWDPFLKGSIDEFRIYNSILTDQQILSSYESGADPYLAINPKPADNSMGAPASTGLSWGPPLGGTPDRYTVYVSNDPNFVGAQIIEVPDGNSCTPVLNNETTYYWRVDTHYGTTIYSGLVWTFTTCALAFDRSPVGDINRDFEVNLFDLQLIADDWLADENSPANLIDIGGNEGIGVDFADYAQFANNWLGTASPLVINEFMASNTNYLQDENGDYDDWLEIYNCSSTTVDLSGMYLTDNLDRPTKWRIPQGITIAPQGYLLFWADGETAEGNTHTNFKLDADGEEIGLFDTDGITLLDSVVFGQQYANISYGRHPDGGLVWRVFDAPSPRVCNCQGYLGIVADTQFSVNRGFYEQPFEVRISTDTNDAAIRYTLDFSSPTESYGFIYDPNSPIQITKTTVVRAVAYKQGYKSSKVGTQTYIFLEDVINQPAWPPGFPTSWAPLPDSADYEMDPRVVYDANYYPTIKNDLLTIPSVCIGIDNNDFFGAAGGIYSNGLTRDLEKPASMEFIDPVTGETYQANIGLRSHGGVGRKDRKHSLRILAKSQYGPSKVEFPFFKDTNVETFDSIVLRATWNYSWIGDGVPAQAQYNRDTFSRDTIRDMGRLTPYGRHVHLYINGLYWGLYKFVERPDDGFAEEHLGGDKTDYDVIKTNAQYWTGPDVIEVVAGDLQAWDTMFALAEQDLSSPENYQAIQQYLDIPAMIDYLLMIFYTGERDAPVLLGDDNAPRNFYAIRKRQPGAGFVFLPWDCEWSLEGTDVNRVNIDGYENPHHLYQRLLANSEFRILLIDKIQERFFNNGVLTPQVSINRYLTRLADIDRAIIGESARWGDSDRPSQPYTRNVEWVTERDRLVNEYFPVRTGIVINQLRSAGMFPSFDAPDFYINGSQKYGGQVNAGDLLTMTASTGTIYYTLDGSDPRLPGGAVNPNAYVFVGGSTQPITLIAESATKKVFVPSSDIGTTWKGGSEPFDDSAWTHGTPITPDKTGGVGYDNASDYLPYISYDVKSLMYNIMASCYIRIPFTISSQDLSKLNSLTLNVRCDDGFVAYINGQEVADINKPNPLLWNSTCVNRPDSVDFVAIDITNKINTLQAGNNILAIQAMNQSTGSSDFLCSLELKGTISIASEPIVLTGTTRVKARVLNTGQWSALSDATFAIVP